MERVFTDDSLQQQFEQDGFVIIDLLNPQELAELNAFSYGVIDDHQGFYTSHHMPDADKRKLIDITLKRYFDNKFTGVLADYRSIFHNLLVKNPGVDSTLAMHQDWCFTNEQQYAGLNVWAPLINSTKNNGCLQVIKASHRYALPVYRGRGFNVLEKIKHDSFENYTTDVEVPAGKCVIMHLALMHSSLPNVTDKTRIAVSAIMVPKEAQVLQYCRNNEADNFIYEVGINESELANFMPTQALNLAGANTIPFAPVEVSMEQFNKIATP